MTRRTLIKDKWVDIHGKKPNLYYLDDGNKIPFELSKATKSFMKKFDEGKF